MGAECFLYYIPNEIIFQLISYLSDEDYIAFANICCRICCHFWHPTKSIFLSKISSFVIYVLKQDLIIALYRALIRFQKCYNVSLLSIKTFMMASSITGCCNVLFRIQQLDLSNCYWLDTELLTTIILEVPFLSQKFISPIRNKIE